MVCCNYTADVTLCRSILLITRCNPSMFWMMFLISCTGMPTTMLQ